MVSQPPTPASGSWSVMRNSKSNCSLVVRQATQRHVFSCRRPNSDVLAHKREGVRFVASPKAPPSLLSPAAQRGFPFVECKACVSHLVVCACCRTGQMTSPGPSFSHQSPANFCPLCRVSDQGQSHGVSGWVQHGEAKGGVSMAFLLTDLLLFSALAVWVTGMVIAIASLLG